MPRTAVCFKRPQRDFFNGFGTAGLAGGGRGVDKINDALLARFFSVCGATMWPGPGDHNPLPPKWEEAEEHVRDTPAAAFRSVYWNQTKLLRITPEWHIFIHSFIPYSTPSSDSVCDELNMEKYTVGLYVAEKPISKFFPEEVQLACTDIWSIVVFSWIC